MHFWVPLSIPLGDKMCDIMCTKHRPARIDACAHFPSTVVQHLFLLWAKDRVQIEFMWMNKNIGQWWQWLDVYCVGYQISVVGPKPPMWQLLSQWPSTILHHHPNIYKTAAAKVANGSVILPFHSDLNKPNLSELLPSVTPCHTKSI